MRGGNQKSSKSGILMKNQTLDSIIPSDYTNSELQRAFFKQHIGKQFKFNTQFMERMQEHKGKKTYQEAITEWERLHQERKNGVKYPLKPQFAYNQYTRDFFADNP
ncbi:MAG: DUF6434 domain-containing protein [Candidatus Peribacteria bacterium]|jgi:hypothetical protein|nr:DUF6434 domain-containing protein [Candidatus Peribacteria bacterium]